MSIAKLTLIGLNNYDHSLFDNLIFENVDHETMVNTILLNCGEFEVLYPNIETLKNMFTLFSNKWSRTVSKWVTALNIEYKPLENYDRYENFGGSEIEIENGNETHSTNGSETVKTDGTETVNNSGNTMLSRSGIDSTNVENRTSAFNSEIYQPNEETESKMTYGSADKNDINVNQTRTPNLTETRIPNLTETRTPNIKKTRTPNLENRIHGNIGVTTSQQMLESELKLQYWNLYNKISNLFMKEFCIMIY